jgi:ribulose-5-phosphate 4-epimerase/fuculose-1-phosphate aldolase
MNTSPRDEGVIKYQAVHCEGVSPAHPLLNQLNQARTQLFDLGLVGAYPDGVGYGNVSIRNESGCIISGTSTGATRILRENCYCYVRNFDILANTVLSEGPIQASSESMTHCAIYQANRAIDCVLHIHNLQLWQQLLDQGYPSTPKEVPYGTPQMAQEMAGIVQRLANHSSLLVMAGHEEGIIAYGPTINLALNQIQAALTLSFNTKELG